MLPDGMNYRVLVLPDRHAISLAVLRKVKQLIEKGATVIGPRPTEATGLSGFPGSDVEVKEIANAVWGPTGGDSKAPMRFGKGRVILPEPANDLLNADAVAPDFEFTGGSKDASMNYIHRRDGDAEIYYVANRATHSESLKCTFRVNGKAPELWDPVTASRRFARAYSESAGHTEVPLEFSPCGSIFVVFREPSAAHPATAASNFAGFTPRQDLAGSWTVAFDPKLGGPRSVEFSKLQAWNTRAETGIRFYSGTATYRQHFNVLPELRKQATHLWLDLGDVRELAEVRLNGKPLGVVWSPPFRMDISPAVKPEGNDLEVEIVNFWPNRIIGDQSLPAEQRLTHTNIRKLTASTPLMDSGLLGPVAPTRRRFALK